MRQLTILVDMDDTIEHLLISWIDCLNKRYGTTVKYEDVTQWDLQIAFPTLTKEQIHAPLSEDSFWKTVRPMDGASEVLQWMKSQGHKVYIVTASAYRTIQPKMENVLFEYFPFLTWDDVIITTNKQLIRGDILFDDAPHNLVNGKYYKVLMDAPHNQDFDAESHGMVRMKSWSEAKQILEVFEISDRMDSEIQKRFYEWRKCPDRFIAEVLGMQLSPAQRVLANIMCRKYV